VLEERGSPAQLGAPVGRTPGDERERPAAFRAVLEEMEQDGEGREVPRAFAFREREDGLAEAGARHRGHGSVVPRYRRSIALAGDAEGFCADVNNFLKVEPVFEKHQDERRSPACR
jgi:hypothetical protein